jgi:hypothetical protein
MLRHSVGELIWAHCVADANTIGIREGETRESRRAAKQKRLFKPGAGLFCSQLLWPNTPWFRGGRLGDGFDSAPGHAPQGPPKIRTTYVGSLCVPHRSLMTLSYAVAVTGAGPHWRAATSPRPELTSAPLQEDQILFSRPSEAG